MENPITPLPITKDLVIGLVYSAAHKKYISSTTVLNIIELCHEFPADDNEILVAIHKGLIKIKMSHDN